MKKLFSVILFIVFTILFIQASELQNGLGFSAGMVSGSGFSYQHKFTNSSYKITFGILSRGSEYDCFTETNYLYNYNTENPVDTTKVWVEECSGPVFSGNIGFQYNKYLHQTKKTSFYILGGIAGYYFFQKYQKQKYHNKIVDNEHYKIETIGDKYYTTEKSLTINSGIGIGMEYKITQNLTFSLELPLTISYKDNDSKIYMYIPQASLIYFF